MIEFRVKAKVIDSDFSIDIDGLVGKIAGYRVEDPTLESPEMLPAYGLLCDCNFAHQQKMCGHMLEAAKQIRFIETYEAFMENVSGRPDPMEPLHVLVWLSNNPRYLARVYLEGSSLYIGTTSSNPDKIELDMVTEADTLWTVRSKIAEGLMAWPYVTRELGCQASHHLEGSAPFETMAGTIPEDQKQKRLLVVDYASLAEGGWCHNCNVAKYAIPFDYTDVTANW